MKTRNRVKTVLDITVASFVLLVMAVQVRPVAAESVTLFLAADFTGRTVDGNTAGNITWTTNGVSDPGDLTAVDANNTGKLAGLFTTVAAADHFAPNLNVDNEGPWTATLTLNLTIPELLLQNIVLDYQHFDNSGNFQTADRIVEWTVTVTGSTSGPLDSVVVTGESSISGAETITFSPVLTLTSSESYDITIKAQGKTAGNNTGLAGLTFNDQTASLIPPSVDAGDDWITWSSEPVTMNATVVNNTTDPVLPLTYQWMVDAASLADTNLDIVLTQADQEDATVEVTKLEPTGDTTVITLTLSANNLGSENPDVTDTMTMDVYDTACEAAKAAGQAMIDPSDVNADCITDINDLIELASAWLADYSLSNPVAQ